MVTKVSIALKLDLEQRTYRNVLKVGQTTATGNTGTQN